MPAQVECQARGGSAAIEEAESPVCDGHGSIEGEVRTISLHNIRYELRANGEELWKVGKWPNELVAAMARHPDGERWVVWSDGYGEFSVYDEELARRFLESVRIERQMAEIGAYGRFNIIDIIMAKIWQILRKCSANG